MGDEHLLDSKCNVLMLDSETGEVLQSWTATSYKQKSVSNFEHIPKFKYGDTVKVINCVAGEPQLHNELGFVLGYDHGYMQYEVYFQCDCRCYLLNEWDLKLY